MLRRSGRFGNLDELVFELKHLLHRLSHCLLNGRQYHVCPQDALLRLVMALFNHKRQGILRLILELLYQLGEFTKRVSSASPRPPGQIKPFYCQLFLLVKGLYRFKTCRTASDLGFHKISYAAR